MSLNCGIVGLPNVGKSTLYNALCKNASAEAANYPFCTIEPNKGRVPIDDDRLFKLAEIAQSNTIIPATLEIIDIAGLVKGASKGEGLGNQFLAHIQQTDAILHVLRCFDDENITHVEGAVDPLRDKEIIETELMLADLASLESQKEKLIKRARGQDKEAIGRLALIEKISPHLEAGKLIKTLQLSDDDRKILQSFHLLTDKPILYIANLDEESVHSGNQYSDALKATAEAEGSQVLYVSAAIEAELVSLELGEQQEYLQSLGLTETSLNRVIRAGVALLDLITYFTVGPKEARAWHIRSGLLAPEGAGIIHTDFERGFIAAEVIGYEDYLQGGETIAKQNGKLRIEGRDYQINDGDVIHFRFNV